MKHFKVSNQVRAYILRSVSINEASLQVEVWCSKGFGRRERIRYINSYSKRLATVFPETYLNAEWSYDEVRRKLLELTRHIDLREFRSWVEIREWFSELESRIVR